MHIISYRAMKSVSLYADAPIIKRGQKLVSLLLNVLTIGIVSTILFFGVDAIASSAGAFKEDQTTLQNKEAELRGYIETTNLGRKNRNGVLFTVDENANVYVISLTYASLLKNGHSEDSLSKTVYGSVSPITPETDMLYSYYNQFKPTHISEYAQKDYEIKDGSTYTAILCNGFDNVFENNEYPYLLNEAAEKIDEAFRNPSFKEGADLRNKLQARYANLLEKAIREVETDYLPYQTTFKKYEQAYKSVQEKKIGEAFLAYLFVTIIHYFVLPLFLKNGQTVVEKMLKRPFRSNKGKEISVVSLLIRTPICLLIQCGIPIIALLFAYGSKSVDVLSYPILGGMPLFMLAVISGLLTLVSYVFTFLIRGQKQTISELAAQMIQVDGGLFNG